MWKIISEQSISDQMDYSHISNPIQYTQDEDEPYDDQLDEFLPDSELLLSKIQYDQDRPQESPSINVRTAEDKIKQLAKTADRTPNRKSKPYCGCGQYYSCTSSLYLHIRSKHRGQPPPGTVGGPKGIVKKMHYDDDPLVKFEEDNRHYQGYPPAPNSNRTYNHAPPPSSSMAGVTLDQVVNNSNHPINEQGGIKICKLCGKTYSCNSSLNLHLKRKHEVRRREDGTVQLESRPEDKLPRNYECTICGLSYGSKSALGLHYNNKHNSKNGAQELPYNEEQVQKCGCGLIYQSRSALNMHVKKKHNGRYPQGTTEKPNLRSKGRVSQNFVLQQSLVNDKQNIYDSDSEEGQNQKQLQQQQRPMEEQFINNERVYKCGCGRNYSCSSSLNLHIKKNHNWVIPKGTIGGPRGLVRTANSSSNNNEQSQQTPRPPAKKQIPPAPTPLPPPPPPKMECSECQASVKDVATYFDCQSCHDHKLCSNCFWKIAEVNNDDHSWILVSTPK